MKTRVRVLGTAMLFLSFLFLLPLFVDASTSYNQRNKCRWWKRHKAEAKISRLYYVLYSYQYQYVYVPNCNCFQWVNVLVYNPHYQWNQVKKDVDRGCSTASASTSYSANINGGWRSASASCTVTNSNVSTSTSTNYGWLSAGETGTAEDGCYDVSGVGNVDFSADTEFGEGYINYSNVNGRLSASANSNFTTVLRISAYEAHIAEGMTEDEIDLADDNGLHDGTFYKLEIRIKHGQIEVLQDGEGTPTEEILSQLEVANNGDLLEILLNNINFEISVPEGINEDDVNVNYFADSVYEPFEDNACGGGEGLNEETPDTPGEMQLPMLDTNSDLDGESLDVNISPNPTKEHFQLTFEMPAEAEVSLELYDFQGRQVKKLMQNQSRAPGQYQEDINTQGLSTGTYLCRLTIGKNIITRVVVIN